MKMAEASKRAATLTTLVIEQVRVPVGLFVTTAKPGKLTEFGTAGPHGGVLFYDDAATEAPLRSDEPMPEISTSAGVTDPLAADPGSDVPPVTESASNGPSAGAVPGTFKQVLVEEGTGAQVEKSDVRRGVRLDDGSFIDCTPQLQRIEDETKLEEMRVVEFVDVGVVERARVEASYYIGASEPQAAKPLKLIFEAMRVSRRVAVVKWSNRSRQSLGVLTAHGNSGCLVLLKLAWAEDLREPPAKAISVSRARVSVEEIKMAVRLVAAMSGKGSLDVLRDDAVARREELYAAALAGEVEPVEEPPLSVEEVALEDAFEASLAELFVTGKG
jgi:non-homologous end joining protein Ku